jgi:preprotein translocase subunit SecG
MLTTILDVIHIGACAVLMFVVLLQQGKGGGLGAAFGGGAAAQVFGGRGAGNILTRATAICAGIFMLTSVSLAYLSSSGDRALKAKAAQEAQKKVGDKGTARPKETKTDPKPTDTPPAPPASAP